jgi:hypothetical protein
MARIRTIKPEFFTSEDIVKLSPFARLLYQATWCEADREGRLVWKPITLKMRYFPADNLDIAALCQELIDAGLVKLYGDGLAFIPSFTAHQHVNPREAASRLPAPPKSTTRAPRVPDASPQNTDASPRDSDAQVGREGKGKEDIEANASCPKPAKGRVSYPPEFEAVWKDYPTDPNMSKSEALPAWKKLSSEDQALLAKSVQAFRAYCTAHPDYRPIHFVRYITKRRFDGFAEGQGSGRAGQVVDDPAYAGVDY